MRERILYKNKWIYKLVFYIVVLLNVFAVKSVILYAHPSSISGTSFGVNNSCMWGIDEENTLWIWPADGVEGKLPSGTSDFSWPWNSNRQDITKVVIENKVKGNSKCNYMFCNMNNCAEMDLSGFDTSSVINMCYTFDGCSGLTDINMSGWDTGSITDMKYMFRNCKKLTSIDVSGWNTGKVENMNSTFYGCSELANLDVSGWNTSGMKDMKNCFRDCKALVSLDVSGWNTNLLKNMSYMFDGCTNLTSLDVSGWNTESLTNISYAFRNCKGLSTLDVSGWNVGLVTDMSVAFNGCSGLVSLDVSNWNTSKVSNTNSMFNGCTRLTNLDVSRWNTSSLKQMNYMFNRCIELKDLDVSGFDTKLVTSMTYTFRDCFKLTNLDVSGWNVNSVENMNYMFFNCSSLTELDLSGWKTSSASSMKDMFRGCYVLKEVILGEEFSFNGNSASYLTTLNTPPSNSQYTGKWIRNDEVYGPYTPQELSENYSREMFGKWIWQEKATQYTIKFVPGPEVGGSMPDQKIEASQDGFINPCTFKQFNHHFDHWEGDNGKTYTDKQKIRANTFNIGDVLTLTAIFVPNDNMANIDDGIMTVILHGGEKLTLPQLPGGTSYQIWEETPSGWQLISETNPAGKVPSNDTINASFTNEYVPGSAEVRLTASKTLDGITPAEGMFEFQLIDDTNQVVQTVSNSASGMIIFEPITFERPGTYAYKIKEVIDDDNGIKYDTHTETVTIQVNDDGAGTLTAETTYDNDGAVFRNETKPGTLTFTKHTDGSGTGDEMFTFEITITDDYGRPLDSVPIVISGN